MRIDKFGYTFVSMGSPVIGEIFDMDNHSLIALSSYVWPHFAEDTTTGSLMYFKVIGHFKSSKLIDGCIALIFGEFIERC